MNRDSFHRSFKMPGPVVLPVIHVRDSEQTAGNVQIAIEEGAQGVFLINHDFGHEDLLPVIADIRSRYPGLWLGVNFLAVTGAKAFPVLAALARDGSPIDAYWGDDARIDERGGAQVEADEIAAARGACGWQGLYFGGTAFKKQREVAPADYEAAARAACGYMDAVTTSGVATGHSADLSKIEAFRAGIGDHALALASGVTAENAADYAPLVDAFLVATGINLEGDFYNIDRARLARLVKIAREIGGRGV